MKTNKTSRPEQYFNRIFSYSQLDEKYRPLARALCSYEFVCQDPMDENRIEDAKGFILSMDGEPDWIPNVFEVIVALAKRMDLDLLYDVSKGRQTGIHIMEMLSSIGLEGYSSVPGSDGEMVPSWNDKDLDETVERLLDRTYSETGEGGLFTLSDAPWDAREKEIWEQMNQWIKENHADRFDLGIA